MVKTIGMGMYTQSDIYTRSNTEVANTVDRENFAVKIISRSRPISLRVQVHTPQDKCLIGDYSQRSLALLIPGSRLNSKNSPGACPYCNHQSLKNSWIERNRENLTTQKFFMRIIFNVKISRSTVIRVDIIMRVVYMHTLRALVC